MESGRGQRRVNLGGLMRFLILRKVKQIGGSKAVVRG